MNILLPSCAELVQHDLAGIVREKGSRFIPLVTGVKGQNTQPLNCRGGAGARKSFLLFLSLIEVDRS